MKIIQTNLSTFYVNHGGQCLDIDWLVTFLLSHCKENQLDSARFCFHRDIDAKLMAMMVIVLNGFIYPPHRHTHKSESYTIVKGCCTLNYYGDDGTLISAWGMKQGDMAFNNTSFFHSLEPKSDVLVFIEHTSGPFKEDGNEFLGK